MLPEGTRPKGPPLGRYAPHPLVRAHARQVKEAARQAALAAKRNARRARAALFVIAQARCHACRLACQAAYRALTPARHASWAARTAWRAAVDANPGKTRAAIRARAEAQARKDAARADLRAARDTFARCCAERDDARRFYVRLCQPTPLPDPTA